MVTAELLEEVSALPASDVEKLRGLCQSDLYTLCKGVLGYKDVNGPTHGAFCRFYDRPVPRALDGQPARRRMGLMPRAHLKTTIATIGDSVRLALADPNDARILIGSETATQAEKILSEIKRHFEINELLRTLFPELVPPRFSGASIQWSSDKASIVRSSVHGVPTWTARGVGAAVTGDHFTHIKCDDLIGFEALQSPAKMEEAKRWVAYIEPLLVSQHTDFIDFTGTRWSTNDLYGHVIEAYGAQLAVFSRRAIELDANGEPFIIFPALHNWEEYERLQRTNPALWFAQYENNPVAGGLNDLPHESLRSYHFSTDGTRVRLEDGREWDVQVLDRVLTADPNSGSLTAPDRASYSVQGLSPEDDLVQLETWSGRPTPSDFVDRLLGAAQRWNVRSVGIEKAGQQNTHFYFQRKQESLGLYFRVEELKPGRRHKEDRVRSNLEPIIRSGKFYLLPSQVELRRQIAQFPHLELWDDIDAAAYGPDLLRKPDAWTDEYVARREDLAKLLLSRRNPVTGY